MAVVSIKDLLDAGVHFGHQTRRWNPKMKRFIHGERNGIYIIDLHKTLERLAVSYEFVRDMVGDGGTLLFVGTKKQAQDSVQSYAERSNMPYINERWLGGMLTNFETISKRVSKMKEYQRMRDSGEFEAMPKKEALLINRELTKLEKNLFGIRNMEKLPDAVFILDTTKENIAVTEANKLGIPIIAVVDTNCDPDLVKFVIPGNDDAIRAGDLMARIMSEAVIEGRFIASKKNPQVSEAPALSDEQVAAKDAAQTEARAAAATQAAEREARVAAGQAPASAEVPEAVSVPAAEPATPIQEAAPAPATPVPATPEPTAAVATDDDAAAKATADALARAEAASEAAIAKSKAAADDAASKES
ncbi:MAG: 30S ribosomal protein S2 [Acidimicrobiales bacterium]